MRTIIKFNKNTDVKEIENVIEAAVKKYVVKNDRYSTPANSHFEITKNGTEYDVSGKRINSHFIDLQFGYDELADDDIYELTIDTHDIQEFEGYVDHTEFSDLVSVQEDKALVADDKEYTETKQSIEHANQLFNDSTAESYELAHTIIQEETKKINQLKKENEKMIIDTEKVENMFETMTSPEISELTGIPERTIQKYKSGELNWLGKNSVALGTIADNMQYVVNVSTGRVLPITKYIDLLIRETVEAWNELDEDEKEDCESFEDFYHSFTEIDSDFETSDCDGNILDAEDQAWNDQTISYQKEQIQKLREQTK